MLGILYFHIGDAIDNFCRHFFTNHGKCALINRFFNIVVPVGLGTAHRHKYIVKTHFPGIEMYLIDGYVGVTNYCLQGDFV